MTYWRCNDCLSVVTVSESLPDRTATCGACGGSMTSMGEVHSGRLFHSSFEIPCDSRCTNAAGPSCDCPCKGVNHGMRRLVKVLRLAGDIPKLEVENPKAAEIAVEYREAADEFSRVFEGSKYGLACRMYVNREWVRNWQDYLDAKRLLDEFNSARRMKTHKGRMGKLTRLTASLKSV